ncbi:MAG TPA: HWE histidine kinase domain-containing protein [Phenylobacterium sp.]|uniref:HWE histidine kinase domain-containing protein n=1 Tax=Phenylobacterium sp. TaxID=1871053 RepID=UPI002B48A5F8|nr:HWE histidine kinase domain-containing protein [Phenylobacterium sp.]HKR88379.1 HWE histidine kinase domain-containing protein [Phenylobacterium sp.]
MADPNDLAGDARFLRGGGATGALIAKLDWAPTALGPLRDWPDALKAATAMILHASLPMSILAGVDGIEIYNDAYAELIGRRHPKALGARARDTWNNSDIIAQAISSGLGGKNLTLRDVELTLDRRSGPEPAWLNIDCSPILHTDGRPLGVLSIVVETTDRVLAERRVADDAVRQRRMFEQAPGFICILQGPDHVFEFVNNAFKGMFGNRAVIGRRLRDVFPRLGEKFPPIMDMVYRQGERYIARAEPIWLRSTRDGPREERFVDFVLEPVVGERGDVTGVFCMGFEVTDQVRAQAAVLESERRLSAAVSIARLGAFEWDLETREATLDARAREIFGFGPDEPLKIEDVAARIDSRDMERLRSSAEKPGVRREFEYRINLPDGSVRNIVSLSDALHAADGRMLRVTGVFDDVTERRRAEKRQRLLINELNHRVKNTLATVQSIAAQTLRSAPDLPRAREAFEARLLALAAAHDLLTAESWHGARLSDVVASAMAPFETVRRPQISRSGPAVWLTAQRALALSMALHELATNAVKYGALSIPEGRVTIRWTVSDHHRLTLSWVENDGPPVRPAERSGFGTRLLQRSLARELGGDVVFTFAPEGVRCEIHCTIADTRPSAAPEPIEV